MCSVRQHRTRRRRYADKTRDAYVHAVAELATYYGRSPDQLSDQETRAWLLHLHLNTHKASSTLNVIVSGLRFFYRFVLQRPFSHIERAMPRVRRQKRRPRPYTEPEIHRLLYEGCVQPKHRAFLMTVYGAGLRLHEACCLRPEHIDRSARQIRIEQGKGRKDRYAILPERLLRELEDYCASIARPAAGFSPAPRTLPSPCPTAPRRRFSTTRCNARACLTRAASTACAIIPSVGLFQVLVTSCPKPLAFSMLRLEDSE